MDKKHNHKRTLSFNWATDFLPGPACYVDKSLYYVFMNKEYRQMFNIGEFEYIESLQVKDVLGDEYINIERHINVALNGNQVTYELDLGARVLQVHYMPDYLTKEEKSNNVEGFFMVGLDISELRRTQINYKNNLEKEVKTKTEHLLNALQELQLFKKEIEDTNKELEYTINHLKQTQNQLVESEKMASLGGLVAGVAHELNTPIGNGILAATYFLDITLDVKNKYKQKNITEKEFKNYLASAMDVAVQINSTFDRTAKLISNFKKVSIDQVTENRKEFELVQYLKDTIENTKTIIQKSNLNIKIKSQVAINLHSYPEVYEQILLSLISNSVQHAYTETDKGMIVIDISKDEKYLRIIYKDDGKGVKKENIPNIFNPFFTTNRAYGGTGLGLNIVYNLITNKLNGTITCNSTQGEGTIFSIIVPLECALKAE